MDRVLHEKLFYHGSPIGIVRLFVYLKWLTPSL